MLVVGYKSKIYDGLVKLGYEIIELDTEGNPVAKKDPNEPKKEVDTKGKIKD